MKSAIRKAVSLMNYTEYTDLKEAIINSSCTVVSFDIFDTLIKRNVPFATDVYHLLDVIYRKTFPQNESIYEKRKKAESIARRKSKKEDVSIYEIYNEIEGIDNTSREWLVNKEIELEEKICQRNTFIWDIYNWCILKGIRVIIVSDMYLPKDVIRAILHNAGYKGWEKLYISNEYGLSKATGNLFSRVIEEEHVSANQILHIGDALKGDFLMPKKLGLKALLIRQENGRTCYRNEIIIKQERLCGHLDYAVINSFVKNNIPEKYDYFERIGYEVVGPILYGYVKWLSSSLDSGEKLYFLAREGFLLANAYNAFKGSKDSIVIRVSRRATAVPRIYEAESLDDLLRIITVSRRNFKISNLLDACNLDEYTKETLYREQSINKNDIIDKMSSFNKQILFKNISPFIKEESLRQKQNIKGYLDGFGFNGKIVLSDVGWHGTIQKALQEIFQQARIKGLYIGKKSKYKDSSIESDAYLFDDINGSRIKNVIMASVDLFELFFLSTDGSAVSYEVDGNHYYCRQAKNEQSNESASIINALQEAALKFITDIKDLDDYLDLDFAPSASSAAYSQFIMNLKMKDISNFKRFEFLNVDKHPLVSEHNLLYYLLHPKEFCSDFLNCGSKSIFLKSVFVLPLPYVKIIAWLRKFDK